VPEQGRRPARIFEGVFADEPRKIFGLAQWIEIGANTRQELTPRPQAKAHTLGRKIDVIEIETNQLR
jgi:hypothetical protein